MGCVSAAGDFASLLQESQKGNIVVRVPIELSVTIELVKSCSVRMTPAQKWCLAQRRGLRQAHILWLDGSPVGLPAAVTSAPDISVSTLEIGQCRHNFLKRAHTSKYVCLGIQEFSLLSQQLVWDKLYPSACMFLDFFYTLPFLYP